MEFPIAFSESTEFSIPLNLSIAVVLACFECHSASRTSLQHSHVSACFFILSTIFISLLLTSSIEGIPSSSSTRACFLRALTLFSTDNNLLTYVFSSLFLQKRQACKLDKITSASILWNAKLYIVGYFLIDFVDEVILNLNGDPIKRFTLFVHLSAPSFTLVCLIRLAPK